MKLSIITVCLNSETTIADTINSVLEQSFSDYEYIIFDGGSTDNTLDIIKRFDGHITLVEGKDEGLFDAMNQAITIASGEVIGILNSDDFYSHNQVLAKVMNAFDETHSDSVYGDLMYVQRENVDRVWRVWKSGAFDKANFRAGWAPPHPTFFVKKRVYDEFGLFDTSFHISADYELMLRFLYRHNVSTAYLPNFLVKMRTGGNSSGKSLSKFLSIAEDIRAWRVNKLKPGLITIPFKILRKVRQLFHHYP